MSWLLRCGEEESSGTRSTSLNVSLPPLSYPYEPYMPTPLSLSFSLPFSRLCPAQFISEHEGTRLAPKEPSTRALCSQGANKGPG